jgi:ribosomal protein S18 acetylase RimI-like enzyme
MNAPSLQSLERAAMSAWPALETVEDGGWVLRFAGGYTRRANCATALGPDGGDLGARIAWCEAAFTRRSLPPVFRLLSASGPAGLDAALGAAGYARGDEALVMTLDLAGARLAAAPLPESLPLDAWLDLHDRFGGRLGAHRETHRAMLEVIPGERLLAVVRADGLHVGDLGPRLPPAGCGLAVADGPLLGLFDLAVDPALRGRGLGGRLVDGLLRWGAGRGARSAYLQVLATNPAVRLYERTGFREAYRYWYRIRPA